MSYNLEDLRAVNLARCTDPVQAGGYGHAHGLRDWSEERWALAMIGEAGETCNAVKKVLRGDGSVADVAEEAADTVIYLDLLCARLGVSLHDAVQAKFNRKSEERGSPIRLDRAGVSRVRLRSEPHQFEFPGVCKRHTRYGESPDPLCRACQCPCLLCGKSEVNVIHIRPPR
jgi:NTP pyrophosphatase (non-canonical NTP hydrolase)